MKNKIVKVVNWWKVTGKLRVLQVILIYLVLSAFIRQIPAVAKYLPDDRYGIPMIAACLYLMVQIFMGMFRDDAKDISLGKFEDTSDDFKKRLKSAKHIDILCSSSRTFLPFLEDSFREQKIECRMLLRQPLKGSEKQKQEYNIKANTNSYEDIKEENKDFKLTIKYCYNTFSRMIIIDNKEVYFGFYKLDNDRLKGKKLEMMHAKSGSNFGNFVLDIAKNRFQSLWDTADDELNEREKLVY